MDASTLTLAAVWFQGDAGNDTLKGGTQADRLEGDDGNDTITDAGGNNDGSYNFTLGTYTGLYGGNDNDTLTGGPGNDYLEDVGPDGAANGGGGSDYFRGYNYANVLITDTSFKGGVATSIGNNIETFRIEGTPGDDVMDASTLTLAAVWFQGDAGNDTLKGGSQADRLEGDDGNDTLIDFGGDNNGVYNYVFGSYTGLYGGNDNDTLTGGPGNDYLEDVGPDGAANGGGGSDYFRGYNYANVLITDTSFKGGVATSIGNNIEAFRIEGTPANDVMDASALTTAPVWFQGDAGNDTLKGGTQADRLDGGDDDDTLDGGGGDNINTNNLLGTGAGLFGGNGNDTLLGGAGNDYLEGDAGNDILTGGPGNDYLYGGDDNDTLNDGPEVNYLDGGNGTDAIFLAATPAPDTLTVANGAVTINGSVTTYINSESLTIDTGAGIDAGTQVGSVTPANYVVHNLEPTVDAGSDLVSSINPFTRTGSFTDIGYGQSWTATADYGEGDGPVAIPVDQVAHTFSLNHTYANGGIFTIRVRVIDNEGNVGTSTFHLQRSGIQVGVAGGIQRSMVETLFVYFDDTMTLNPGWFTLQRLSAGATPTVNATSEVVSGRTVATLTFSGAGLDTGNSLQDGNWRLTLNGAFIITSTGQQYDGDADGNPGGNYVFNFHRLFGDANGDRTVDGSDFSLFGNSFGLTNGQAGFNPAFDGNVDGTVDGTDFAQFGNRFGITLP